MNIIASYIYNIFINSNKKHLLITGSQNSGKTLLFNTIKELLDVKHILCSYKDIDKNIYIQYNEHKAMIGRYNENIRYFHNPMECIEEGFKSVGIPFFKYITEEWAGIDEIGFLESRQEEFLSEIRSILDKKRLLAVLRKQDLDFINELKNRDDVYLVDLDSLSTRFGCIIMASGKSIRYGDNKLFEIYQGKTFIDNILYKTENLFYKRIVVTRDLDVKKLCEERNIEVIYHDYPYRSQAIRLGIEYMEDVDSCMFVNVDQPLLQRESIIRMLEESIFCKDEIIRLSYQGTGGSPVLFSRRFFNELKNLPEKKGGSEVIRRYLDDVRYVECSDKYELYDIDTKEDFERLMEFVY